MRLSTFCPYTHILWTIGILLQTIDILLFMTQDASRGSLSSHPAWSLERRTTADNPRRYPGEIPRRILQGIANYSMYIVQLPFFRSCRANHARKKDGERGEPRTRSTEKREKGKKRCRPAEPIPCLLLTYKNNLAGLLLTIVTTTTALLLTYMNKQRPKLFTCMNKATCRITHTCE